jgi:hypothetical protein
MNERAVRDGTPDQIPGPSPKERGTPAASPTEPTPAPRSTATADVAVWYDAVSTPAPPSSTSASLPPMSVSLPSSPSRRLAAGIPGARFVAIPGRNHIPLKTDPAMARFLEEVRLFLS